MRINLLILIIKFYRFFISPLLGGSTCRFYPTCSKYAKLSIILHGNVKGLWLILKRITRCHPFCNGGYDPVPPRK